MRTDSITASKLEISEFRTDDNTILPSEIGGVDRRWRTTFRDAGTGVGASGYNVKIGAIDCRGIWLVDDVDSELVGTSFSQKFCDFEEKFAILELRKRNFDAILTFWRRILQTSGSENPC